MRRLFVTAVAVAVSAGGLGPTGASDGGPAAAAAPSIASSPTTAEAPMPMTQDGWLDLRALLVASDGSRGLGNHRARFNDSRDRGTKIVFFDPARGDNDTAGVYWWDGRRIVDSGGRAANPKNGKAYGTDPLVPDEAAIQPFRHGVGMVRNADADPRLRTHDRDGQAVAGGYPDWFLYRRGRTHDTFDSEVVGGRSEREPMVLAAYGPPSDGRAIIAPALDKPVRFRDKDRPAQNPMAGGTKGEKKVWVHMVYSGLDVRTAWSMLGTQDADSFSGGPAA
jgi:hypothetical protein